MPCVALFVFLLATPHQTLPCADVASCRTAALEAAARQEYESFHDLAWRAAQRGKPNDPDLMYLLARAQSLSGRPGDALVMLRRLAQLGVVTDAAQSADFERVRALPGWTDLVEFMSTVSKPSAPADAPSPGPKPVDVIKPARTSKPGPGPTKGADVAADKADPPRRTAERKGATRASEPAVTDPAAPAPPKPATTAPPESTVAKPDPPPADKVEPAAAENALALTSAPLDAVGLAYDSASRRFVVGDRIGNKVIVADEVFKRVNDLIGALSGGFGTLTAVEIDSRRGDLWLASSGEDGAASLHKLQLVSGRVLFSIDVPDSLEPALLTDIVIDDAGELRIVDARGARLLTVRPGARAFGAAISWDVTAPVSIAPAGDIVYVAHQAGLSAADARSGRLRPIKAAGDLVLTGIVRVRPVRGGLVAIAASGGGQSRLIRIRLSRDRSRVTAIEPLDPSASSQGSALTIGADAAYYVAHTPEGTAIRRVSLR